MFALALVPQAFAATPPTAGSEIKQIPQLPVPSKKTLPEIQIQQGNTPAAPSSDQVKILIKSLHVTGQTVYPEAELLAVTGFKSGSELSLAELRAMASKIADFYHEHGYFLAQAYLPAQDIQNGSVTIAVVEGQYGKVTLNNSTNLSNSLVNGILDGVGKGEAIAISPLERRLLLLSDIPGVLVKSTLVPGASVGASNLIIDVTPGQGITGSVDADNEGSRYTGSNRLGITENINEPFGHGDVATLRVLVSADRLNYARVAYQTQIEKAKIGTAYTSMSYRLGQEFGSLEASGTARIASFYGSYPLIRTRTTNLSAQINYDAKTFRDIVNATPSVTDKKAHVWMTSLNGDHQDALGGGGTSGYSLTWTSGEIDIGSPTALANDAATVQSNGYYNKLGFNAMRLQSVTETTSLYAVINGQIASKNLDVSEKMGLGGADAVRAYPSGEAYGDQGYVLSLEARRVLPQFSEKLPGQMQVIGFVDTGTVTSNKNAITSENRKTLSGAGLGVNWMNSNDFVVKMYYAHKLGDTAAVSAPDSMNRFWIQGVKYF